MYKVITKDEEEVTVSVCTRCTLNWENQNFAVQFLGRKNLNWEKCLSLVAHWQVCWGIVLIYDWCGRAQPTGAIAMTW